MLDALSLGVLFLVSLALTLILWKRNLLRIRSALEVIQELEARTEADRPILNTGEILQGAQGPASFKVDKIFEAEIPAWMAKPPISYAICFLIVAVAVSVIMLALAPLLRILK